MIQKEFIPVFEWIEFRERELPDISIICSFKDKEKVRKKPVHAKSTFHGLTDSKTDRYIFALVIRSDVLL